MISCQQVIQQLSRLLDHELDPEMEAQIEQHLQICRQCAIVVDTTRRKILILGDERPLEILVEMNESIRRHVWAQLG